MTPRIALVPMRAVFGVPSDSIIARAGCEGRTAQRARGGRDEGGGPWPHGDTSSRCVIESGAGRPRPSDWAERRTGGGLLKEAGPPRVAASWCQFLRALAPPGGAH